MRPRTPWHFSLDRARHSITAAYATTPVYDSAQEERRRIAEEAAVFIRQERARRERQQNLRIVAAA